MVLWEKDWIRIAQALISSTQDIGTVASSRMIFGTGRRYIVKYRAGVRSVLDGRVGSEVGVGMVNF